MSRSPTLPLIIDCIKGRAYKLSCRNLSYGIFDGKDGFIGIRQKFNWRYLFTEFHWDQGEPFGTVSDAIDLGVNLPDEIPPVERLGEIEVETGRPTQFDASLTNPFNINRTGWTKYVDTGEPLTIGTHTQVIRNTALFEWLDAFAKKQGLVDCKVNLRFGEIKDIK